MSKSGCIVILEWANLHKAILPACPARFAARRVGREIPDTVSVKDIGLIIQKWIDTNTNSLNNDT